MKRLHAAQRQLTEVVARSSRDSPARARWLAASEQLRQVNDLFHQLIHAGMAPRSSAT